METVIKTIPIQNGELYGLMQYSRFLFARYEATLEISEISKQIHILGKGRVITQRVLAMLIAFQHEIGTGIEVDRLTGFLFQ